MADENNEQTFAEMMQEKASIQPENERVLLVQISCNENHDNYSVRVGAGSTVGETAFAVAVLIKALTRDGYTTYEDFISRIQNYCNNPEYDEVIPDESEVEQTDGN